MEWDGHGILEYPVDCTDGSGAMKIVITKDIAAQVLQRNLSQLILQASLNQSHDDQSQPNNNSISTLNIEIPSTFDMVEAVVYLMMCRRHSIPDQIN